MIWIAPWALFGVLAVALPIVIHLLGRGRASTQRFPSLRFIERSRLLPTRRTRLHDLLLLLVRVAIVASAALALAQPYWRTATRRDAFEQTLARAIILDTSASVRQVLSVDSARALAERLASDANVSVQLSSTNVSLSMPGAVAWLAQQSERRELMIVSDFQTGVIDAQSIARIPAEVGVRLLRVGTGANAAAGAQSVEIPIETEARFGANVVTARVSTGPSAPRPAATQALATRDIEWTVRDTVPRAPLVEGRELGVRILAGALEQTRANAALSAANTLSEAAAGVDTSRAIVIVTPGYEQRSSLLATARVPASAWVLDAIARLSADVTLREAAATKVRLVKSDETKGLVVTRSMDGSAVVTGLESMIGGRATLLLICDADAGALATATLVVAARNAIAPRRSLGERDPSQIADSVLRAWQRMPSAVLRPTAGATNFATVTNGSVVGASGVAGDATGDATGGVAGDATGDPPGDASDGRWLWMVALALLALETWLRRSGRVAPAEVAT